MSERIPDPPPVFKPKVYTVAHDWVDEEDHGAGWYIKDFQGKMVARCMAEHDAKLICNLLNKHT